MTLQLAVWSDFICPWCYLVSQSIERLRESHGIAVTWKAFELRPKGSPPPAPDYIAKVKASRPRLEAIASTHYGIQLNPGPARTNSRLALIGLKYAQEIGKGTAYHKAVFDAYFLDGKPIEDQATLIDLASEAGIVRGDFVAALQDTRFDGAVDADIAEAHQREIRSVPTLLFENKYMIPGAQPYEELVRYINYLKLRIG